MIENLQSKINEFFQKDKKIKIALLIGSVCILILIASEFIPAKTSDKSNSQPQSTDYSQYEQQVEERLSSILSRIEGVGKLSVMVTLENSGKKVFSTDEENSVSTGEKDTQSSNSRQYVVVQKDSGDEPLESEATTPEVRGVIVVCEGAENPTVKGNVVSAVSAAFNISSSSISVVKGAQTSE